MLILVELRIELAWSNQQSYVSYSTCGLEASPPLILSSGHRSLKDSEKAHDTYKQPSYQILEQDGVYSSTLLILHTRRALYPFLVST